MTLNYQIALDDARKELGQLLSDREKLERRIAAVKSMVAVLTGATAGTQPPNAEDLSSLGISDAMRRVLSDYASDVGMTPAQIRDALNAGSFDLSQYASALTVIHNTLQRLETQGEVVSIRPDAKAGENRSKTRWLLTKENNMELAEQLDWKGLEVHAPEAIWVCTKSRSRVIATSPDGIDYLLEFTARPKRVANAPDTRNLHLRTSGYLVGTNLGFVKLVVEGQMLQTAEWNPFMEVYKQD